MSIRYGGVQAYADSTRVQLGKRSCLQQGDFLEAFLKRLYQQSDFRKALIPAWTSEETESVPLNLGKCWKLKNTHKLRMQKRGDKQKPSQREGIY